MRDTADEEILLPGDSLKDYARRRRGNRNTTRCMKGHELENNSYMYRGWRRCRTCDNLRSKKYYQKKKGLSG